MSRAPENPNPTPPAETVGLPIGKSHWRQLGIGLLLLALLYSPWLLAWVRFTAHDELSSYALLIPLISAYLAWQTRDRLVWVRGGGKWAAVWAVLAAGFAAWAVVSSRAPSGHATDYLTPAILSFDCALVSLGLLTVGPGVMRPRAFAIAFLAFAAPLPSGVINALEVFFQYTSADAADWIMQLIGLPALRTGLQFQLAGITIQVAQECSGIRSSLVLFIVSILAGRLLLRSPVRRAVLAFFVIPLGIARNGFRIVTISALCTHVGPHMIDSKIHHSGGPIFFAASLVPMFLFLYWLRRAERPSAAPPNDGRSPHILADGKVS